MDIKIRKDYKRKLERLKTRYGVDEHVIINGLLGNHFIAVNKSKYNENIHHLGVSRFILDGSKAKQVIWNDFVQYCNEIGVGTPEKTSMSILGEILIWKKNEKELVIGTDNNNLHIGEIEKIAEHFKLKSKFIDIRYYQYSFRIFNICVVKEVLDV